MARGPALCAQGQRVWQENYPLPAQFLQLLRRTLGGEQLGLTHFLFRSPLCVSDFLMFGCLRRQPRAGGKSQLIPDTGRTPTGKKNWREQRERGHLGLSSLPQFYPQASRCSGASHIRTVSGPVAAGRGPWVPAEATARPSASLPLRSRTRGFPVPPSPASVLRDYLLVEPFQGGQRVLKSPTSAPMPTVSLGGQPCQASARSAPGARAQPPSPPAAFLQARASHPELHVLHLPGLTHQRKSCGVGFYS